MQGHLIVTFKGVIDLEYYDGDDLEDLQYCLSEDVRECDPLFVVSVERVETAPALANLPMFLIDVDGTPTEIRIH